MFAKILPKLLRYSKQQCRLGSTNFLNQTGLKNLQIYDRPRFFATSVDIAAAEKQSISSGSVEKPLEHTLNRQSKAGLSPPTAEKSPKRVAKSENSDEIYVRQNYHQICDELLRENDVSRAPRKDSIRHLTYLLPKTAVSLQDERNFVDRYLTAWWKDLVSPNGPIGTMWPRRRMYVLKCLYALDHVTDGDVVKKLTWDSIEYNLIRNHMTNMSNKFVGDTELALFNIQTFLNDPKYVQTIKPQFVKNYSKFFWQKMNAYTNEEQFLLYIRHSLGPVLSVAAKCGFQFSAAESQTGEFLISPPNFARFCLSACHPNAELKRASDFYRFFNCSLIGEALMLMQFDPEQYQVSNFWSSYFSSFMTLLEKLSRNSQPDTERQRNLPLKARQLDTCLNIALRFGKLAEFETAGKPRFAEHLRPLIGELEDPTRLATLELLKANQNRPFCVELSKLYEK